MPESNPLWLITVALGPVILAVAVAYAMFRRRRLSPREREAQLTATERNYSDPTNDG